MTSTSTPIKIETTDLDEVEQMVKELNNRMGSRQTKINELQAKIDELKKIQKEDEEKLKKIQGEDEAKKKKFDNIKKMLETTKTKMDNLDTSIDNAINSIEIPPKSS